MPASKQATWPAYQNTIKVCLDITAEEISGLLCSGFEGFMFRQWGSLEDYKLRPGVRWADFAEGGKYTHGSSYFHVCQLVPLVAGCKVIIKDHEDKDKLYILDHVAIERGLRVLAEGDKEKIGGKHHFANWLNDQSDCITGDVFIQCCIFGEVKYG